MSSEGVQRLQAAYEAFKTQDIPTVMAAFDEQIEWTTPDVLPFGGVAHGHEGVGGFFSAIGQHFTELHVDPEEFIDAGDTVVVPIHLWGSGAGGAFDTQSLHVWRLRDGKAISFREYPDTARLLEAIGQPVSGAA